MDNLDRELEESIELARSVGVPEEEILKSMDDVDAFFLGGPGDWPRGNSDQRSISPRGENKRVNEREIVSTIIKEDDIMANEVKKNEVQNTQATEGTKGQEPPKDQKPVKPNIFKRAWDGIKNGFKAVRESPQAAAIGAVAGSLVTLGVGAYIEHKIGGSYVQGSLPEPDDGIEIEDTGEDYIEGPTDEDDGE